MMSSFATECLLLKNISATTDTMLASSIIMTNSPLRTTTKYWTGFFRLEHFRPCPFRIKSKHYVRQVSLFFPIFPFLSEKNCAHGFTRFNFLPSPKIRNGTVPFLYLKASTDYTTFLSSTIHHVRLHYVSVFMSHKWPAPMSGK